MTPRFFCLLILSILFLNPLSISAQDVTPTPDPEIQSNVTIHVVQRGENLYRIALSYGITVEELAAMNGITDASSIQVGQRLLVPAPPGTTITAAQTHVVQPGETLRSIAELYGTTVEELATLNNITDVDSIYVGQVLTISSPVEVVATDPAPVAAAATDIATPVLIHVVQPGETAFRIATRYGITVNELASTNGLADPSLIYVGQQLIIPGFEPLHLALDLPAPVTGLDVLPLLLIEGEAVRVRLTTSESVVITGAFLDHVLNVFSELDGTQNTLLFAVPMGTAAGVYPLTLTVMTASDEPIPISINLQVLAGGYGSETISLLADRGDLLDPNVEQAELEIIQRVMSAVTLTRYFNGPMGLPAPATITSPFGVTRSYNGGEYNRVHTGTDFAGAPGTPVLAAAPGVVVLVDSLNVRGLATVIDHGWGVFSGYWHQSEQYVQLGDTVNIGQTIGTIGSTGRVTGAHLHWEVWVGGFPVDPMQWVRLAFP